MFSVEVVHFLDERGHGMVSAFEIFLSARSIDAEFGKEAGDVREELDGGVCALTNDPGVVFFECGVVRRGDTLLEIFRLARLVCPTNVLHQFVDKPVQKHSQLPCLFSDMSPLVLSVSLSIPCCFAFAFSFLMWSGGVTLSPT